MDFNDEKVRKECLRSIQEIGVAEKPALEKRLNSILNESERILQRFLQETEFKEGIWWKSYHNLFVPPAMVAICNKDGFSRDLVYAAQLHDAGNALLKIGETLTGAGWEGVDKRLEHMNLGAAMIYSSLGTLRAAGQIDLAYDRILKLTEIVKTHDYPYIGKKLQDREAQAHRCADRSWSVTAMSFYKDLIAYCSDKNYAMKTADLGIEMSPETLLAIRIASFYENKDQLPEALKDQNIIPRMLYLTESQRCEPPYTPTGKKLVDDTLSRRVLEIEKLKHMQDPGKFAGIFLEAFRKDVDGVYSAAETSVHN